jgi:hypothetical protein
MTNAGIVRWIVFLGAALFGSACILQTAAPTTQGRVALPTREGAAPDSSSQALDGGSTPTWTLTLSPELTLTATIAPVTLTAGQALSCVKGPDWKLYEWVAGIAEGETVTLIARAAPEIPDYYVVRKSDGTECWAFSGSSTINGSTAGLPVRETPALPTVVYVIENKVMIPLCEVYIRAKDEAAWGANRLTVPNIAIDATFSVTLTAGYYDVQIKDCLATALYEEHGRAIGPDPTYRRTVIANDVDFYIQNNYPFTICWIERMMPDGSWGYLYNTATDGGPLYSGGRKNITLRAGWYYFRVTRCTSVVLPITGVYIRPGMGGVTYS